MFADCHKMGFLVIADFILTYIPILTITSLSIVTHYNRLRI